MTVLSLETALGVFLFGVVIACGWRVGNWLMNRLGI